MNTYSIPFNNVRLDFDGEKHNLFLIKTNSQATMPVEINKETAIKICEDVDEFLNDYTDAKYDALLTNDGDNIGIIVDVWRIYDCENSFLILFDDYL